MHPILLRLIAVSLAAGSIAACSSPAAPSGPPGQPTSSNVNPITGQRPGSSSSTR